MALLSSYEVINHRSVLLNAHSSQSQVMNTRLPIQTLVTKLKLMFGIQWCSLENHGTKVKNTFAVFCSLHRTAGGCNELLWLEIIQFSRST